MSKRSVILNMERNLLNLKHFDCKFLVRVDGFRLVGIVTKIRRDYDPQIGKDRLWAMGITLGNGGQIFEEPLDRKNPKSGRLESIVVRETPFMMITARKTSDPKDDENNFNWLPHQFHLDALKELEDELFAQQRIMSRLDEDYRAQQGRMDLVQRDAKIAVEESNNLKATVDFQSRRLLQLERENQEMYTLLQRLRAHGLEVEGELAVDLKRAMDRGREKAMSPHEVRMNKLQEDEEEKKLVETALARRQNLDKLMTAKNIDTDDIRDIVREEIKKGIAQASRPPVIKQKPAEEITSQK